MSRYFPMESLLFLYTLKVCTAADNPPKEVIIHNKIILWPIDIWEEPKWEMAFVISRTAVNPLFKWKGSGRISKRETAIEKIMMQIPIIKME